MGNTSNDENWAARERLRRVEFVLWWRGWVGRNDLVDGFGISMAQASGDLQRYAELNPGAMIYHTSRKRYESTEGMVCRQHEPAFDEAVRFFLGGEGVRSWPVVGGGDRRLALLSLPERRLDPGIARRVMMALLDGRELRVRYLSVSSGSDGWRDWVPGGLGWDGRRWHVRAWCGMRGEWRDFVLGRVVAAEWPGRQITGLPEDSAWREEVRVRLRVNPELDEKQREALSLDYGLVDERMELRVRRAMLPYLLADLFIDPQGHRALARHFVVEE